MPPLGDDPLRPPGDVTELEDRLSRPRDETIEALRASPGDIVILGAGGKMGPSLARMARRAASTADGTDTRRRVIAVSRYSNAEARAALEQAGVETASCDLLDPVAVDRLPDAPNVVFMAGQKFGTASAPSMTWAMNTLVPAWCAARYAGSRIAAFSTGNVYPLVPVDGAASREVDAPSPLGEYAASCLGRERMFEHASVRDGTPVAIIRLNYAVDLRYGVLVDIATKVRDGVAIDLVMGFVNVIWQGDANRIAIETLTRAAVPPYVVNVTGHERLSVRAVAQRLGELLGRRPVLAGTEAPDALLSETTKLAAEFPPLELDADTLVAWVASWILAGNPLLDRPTKFERRDGSF